MLADYDAAPGWPAGAPRIRRAARLRFTARWNPKPLWKRALLQRGSDIIGRLQASHRKGAA